MPAPRVQLQEGRYLWLGDYDRQVASTIDYRLKGDGRLYGLFMKTDSYVEGTGSHELWQTFVQTRHALSRQRQLSRRPVLLSSCAAVWRVLCRRQRSATSRHRCATSQQRSAAPRQLDHASCDAVLGSVAVAGPATSETHQCLHCRRDEWTDHKVPVVDFLLTSGGYVADHQRVINLSRVTGLGFALSGGGEVQEEGPFKLCVSSIEAGYDLDRSSGNEE